MSAEFNEKYHGVLRGVLKWEKLDELWAAVRLRKDAGWYLYAPGHDVPEKIADADEVEHFIAQIDDLLHKEHDEDYCGIVYTDDFESPSLVKIYDPHNLGVVCGSSDNPPLPGWVMSLSKPPDLAAEQPIAGNRKRWWARLWQ